MRGAWIEMLPLQRIILQTWSLPVRGAWIEIAKASDSIDKLASSLPVRGAWIEIKYVETNQSKTAVAPCEGSVD